MLDRLLRAVYLFLFFIVPLAMVPFTSELFEFNKMMLIYTAASLVFLIWSLKMIVQNRLIFKRSIFDIFFLLFLLTQILSTIFSIDFHTSIFGYYGRFNGGLISIIAYLTLYYGYVSNFDRSFTKKALKVALLSSVIVILWGIPGKLGVDASCVLFTRKLNNSCWTDQFRPAERMFSTLGQPNWLGQYLLITFFPAYYFFCKNKKRTINFLLFLYLILSAMCILFTRSRSAIGVLVVGAVVFPLFLSSYQKKIRVLVVFLIMAVILFKTGVAKIDRFFEISTYLPKKIEKNISVKLKADKLNITESFDIRKIVWQGAVDLGNTYPFFGTGVETFAYSYNFVRPKAHNLTSEWDFIYNKAHNEYLNYLATTGYSGVVSYLLVIAVALLFLFKNLKRDELAFPFIFSYISIIITNFVGFSTSSVNLYFYLIPAMAIVSTVGPEKKRQEMTRLTPKHYLLGLASILLTISTILYLINYYEADILYARAVGHYNNQDYQSSAGLLQKAQGLHYEHVYEDKLSYSLANLALLVSPEKSEKETVTRLKNASEYYNVKSLKTSPRNLYYWKTRAKNYYLFYQITLDKSDLEKGIEALETAKKFAPTDPKLDYNEAVYYSLIEKKSKAIAAIDRVIALKPDYNEAYLLKEQLLKK